MIRESFFQSLPKEAQHVIEAAAQIAQIADRASDVVATKVTSMEILKKHLKIYSPNTEEKNMFKNLCQGPVVEWLKGEIGSEIVDSVLADVARIEKELGY